MNHLIIINIILGIVLGYALHRSRFCFAGAFRDFILFKDTGLLKAILISLMISSILFSIVQYYSYQNGTNIPGNFYSIGLHTVVGGVFFGVGMVIAGGCICSIFLRIGEGFRLFFFVLLGLGLGTLVGAKQYYWWIERFTWFDAVFLGDLLGWPLAVLAQLVILAAMFFCLHQLDKRAEFNTNKGEFSVGE